MTISRKFQLVIIFLSIVAIITTFFMFDGYNKEKSDNLKYVTVYKNFSLGDFLYLQKNTTEELYYQYIDSSGKSSEIYKISEESSQPLISGKNDIVEVKIFSKNEITEEDVTIRTLAKSEVSEVLKNDNVLGEEKKPFEIPTDILLEKLGVNYFPFSHWYQGEYENQDFKIKSIKQINLIPIVDGGENTNEYLNAMLKAKEDLCLLEKKNSECENIKLDFNFIVDENGDIYEGFSGSLYQSDNKTLVIGLIESSNEESKNTLISFVDLLKNLYGISKTNRIQFDNKIDSKVFSTVESAYKNSLKTPAKVTSETPEIEKAAHFTEESVTDSNTVKINNKLQVVTSGDLSEEQETILKMAGLKEDSISKKKYKVYDLEENISLQVMNQMNMISEEGSVIQPNYVYRLSSWDNTNPDRSIPTDYNTSTHWYLEKIKTPEVWSDLGGCATDNTCGGDESVIVAILDTGVAYENYDFDTGSDPIAEKFDPFYVDIPTYDTQNGIFNEGHDREFRLSPELGGVNFVSPYDAWQDYSCNSLRYTGTSPDPCNTVELEKINHANDDFGHGSFIASIIASATGDESPNRLVGISHNISIMPVRVFTPNDTVMCMDYLGNPDPTCSDINNDFRTVAFTTNIIDGIEHAVANNANIINLSLSGPGFDDLVNGAIQNAINSGVLVVVAAGNSNDNASYYFPANSPGAFVVGATDYADNRASYSNYGSEIDIVAPAGDSDPSYYTPGIYYQCSSTQTCSDETNPNLFETFTSQTSPTLGAGTSYSAPMVAAAAALLLYDDPTLTVAELRALIQNSAQDLGPVGKDDDFGYGLLDIEAALGREENVEDPIPNDQYFTWYDTSRSDRIAWVLVGNPSTTSSASVNIKVGSTINNSYSIPPGGRITPKYLGILDGPVVVTSSIPIFSSERVSYEGSFNEYSGIVVTDLSKKYYFPIYDHSSLTKKSWILVGNPSATETATVNIKIGTVVNTNYSIPPGGRITPKWVGLYDGPVVISSNIDVYASQRSSYEGFFNEFAGIPESQLNTKYYFTWYDTSQSDRKATILVGNPSLTQTATVNIKIANNVNSTFTLGPGLKVLKSWTGILNGPVEVSSNIPIYTTQRAYYIGSFNEYAGIPVNNLKTKYYFTWYDTSKTTRKAWILVGNPSLTQTATVNIKIGNSINQNFTINPNSRITPKWYNILNGPVIVTSNIPVYATQRADYEGSFNEYPGIFVSQ